MSTIIERFNRELEAMGKRAQTALDEGRLQIQRLGLMRRQDLAFRELGQLTHRKARGVEVDALQVDALLSKLDGLAAELAAIDKQVAALRAEPVAVSEVPAPETAQAADSTVVN
jgi:hypothetical protein